jgi:hypothetical protein
VEGDAWGRSFFFFSFLIGGRPSITTILDISHVQVVRPIGLPCVQG